MKDIKIGEFQKFHYPAFAELHDANKVGFRSHIEIPSELIEGKSLSIETHNCPRCHKECDELNRHGDAWKCGQCNLNRQLFGDNLYIWENR